MGSASAPRPETPEENGKRFASYVAGKDPLEMQADAPTILSRLILGVADDLLRRRPAPAKWSVVEIIAHLADDELATTWRYHQMIEHSGEKLWSFDQDHWSELGCYGSRDTKAALDLFHHSSRSQSNRARRVHSPIVPPRQAAVPGTFYANVGRQRGHSHLPCHFLDEPPSGRQL